MANNKCGGCGLNPPVIPDQYPFTRPARDSYGFCPCPPTPHPSKNCHPGPKPNPHRFPTFGNFIGSGFALQDTWPYLIDTTTLQYGQVLSYSEAVVTKVTRRNDSSCINLAATFDLTNTDLNNVVLMDFLKKNISKKYAQLQGVLPIIKDSLKFKIYYTITDYDGGVVHNGVIQRYTQNEHFHFTDVKDMYVTSAHDIVMENIPAMTYAGLYTITIDKVEVYVYTLDTLAHSPGGMNPFYQFTDNNMKIMLQHDIIEGTEPDNEILVSETPVNVAIDYRANVTNRIKLSFTAFMSMVIAAPDTEGVWDVLTEPTEEVVAQMRQELSQAEQDIIDLQNRDAEQQAEIDELRNQVTLNKNNISSLTNRVTYLENSTAMYKSLIDDLTDRVLALENRPLALVSYRAGKEFVTPQITWNGYGNLYQCARNFTANGDFDVDVANGNLVPVISDPGGLEPVIERLSAVETTATDTATEVTTLSETVATQGEAITGLNETVLALNNDIDTLSDDVDELKDAELGKNKVIIKNLVTGEKQYVNSYGAAATILNNDLEGSYKVYPGEGYSQITLSDRTFENTTSLKQIEFPTSMTTLGRNVFAGSGITTLTIPQTITSSSYEICLKCNDLTSVTIDSPNLQLKEASFSTCPNLTTANILSVGKMETTAFYKTGLTEIRLPELDYLNTAAFNMCPNLETAVITSGEIKDHCFGACPNLKTVYIKIGVTAISDSAFGDGNDGIEFFVASASWASAMSNQPWGCTNANIHWSYSMSDI